MIKPNAILEINLKNLEYNYKKLSKIANNSACAAVIKADAYGTGVLKIFETLYKNNCRHFFVATTEEALKIREKKSKGSVYVLNGLENNKLQIFYNHKIIPIINDKNEFNIISKNFNKFKKFKYGIHVDTGINRLGINYNEFFKFNFTDKKFSILIK